MFDVNVHYNPAMSIPAYTCTACGNRTRFDVYETRRARRFHHFGLGGDLLETEDEVLSQEIERVVCRWCGSDRCEPRLSVEGADPKVEQDS